MKDTVILVNVLFIVVLPVAIGCRGCLVDESAAVRALDTAGYSDVKVKHHAWLFVAVRGCGADAARFDAEARNPAGKRVSVYVCVGWPFKGATVRSE